MSDADINIVINAKVDGLQQGLRQAEQQVEGSAKKMGDGGFKDIGGKLADKVINGLMKGLAVAAITQLVGGSLNTALEGIQTGKSVGKIADNIASGLVKMGESLPVAGIFVTFFDGLVNGSTRAAAALQKNIIEQLAKTTAALDAFLNATSKYGDDTADMKARREAKGDPLKLAKIETEKAKKQDIEEAEELKEKERKLNKEQAASMRTRLRIDPEDDLPEHLANQLNRQRKEAFVKIDNAKNARLAERDAAFQETSMNIQNEKDQAEKALIPADSNEGKPKKLPYDVGVPPAAVAEGFTSSETARQLGVLVSTSIQQLAELLRISAAVEKGGGGIQ